MNAIVGAPDQRPDESGSFEKRESSSVSTTLDRGPYTFLPAVSQDIQVTRGQPEVYTSTYNSTMMNQKNSQFFSVIANWRK